MSDELVSVIIPCYNYEAFVGEAIASALGQNLPNMEIIVVDDASTDHSVEVVQNFPTVTLIEHPVNKGLPYARNTAIREAKGKYIIPLDADDCFFPGAVPKIIAGHGEGIGIVRFGLMTFGECPHQVIMPPPNLSLLEELRNNIIFVSSSFPKAVWEAVGGYSEDMNDGFEDWEFWVKIMKAGYKVATIEEPLFQYRIHGLSKGKTRPLERTINSRQRLIDKHYDTYFKLLKDSLHV